MKTHWKKFMNPDYLGSWSLQPGEEKTLTIKQVVQQDVAGSDGKKEKLPVIHFVEKDVKPMVLNTTNSKMISALYDTPYVDDWVGKQIVIRSERIRAFGETVDALRVKNEIPKSKVKTVLNPEHKQWERIKKGLATGGCTIDDVKRNYELSDEHEKMLTNG